MRYKNKIDTNNGFILMHSKLFHTPCDEVECLDKVDREEPTKPETIAAADCNHE